MFLQTKLDVAHIELIKIFIKANDLTGIIAKESPLEINGRFHMCISLESAFEDAEIALTFLGIRNCGVQNMFDDYLMKCGVSPGALQPKSIYKQIQDEREQRQNEDFMKHLTGIKENYEHPNK